MKNNFGIIVAGSRSIVWWKPHLESSISFTPEQFVKVFNRVQKLWRLKIKNKRIFIISGGAEGIDKLGEIYAKQNGIDLVIAPALWDYHGKKAGMLRNNFMVNLAEGLIAIWDGSSRGTMNMVKVAQDKGLPVYFVNFKLGQTFEL